jgi:glutaredoxin
MPTRNTDTDEINKGDIVKLIRWLLGRLILLFDALFAPKPAIRPDDVQQAIDAQTTKLKLYQYLACPFCVKTRRAIRRLGLNIETRDALRDPVSRKELITQGGKAQVPCLQIFHDDGRVEWLYESSDIVTYLQTRFA